MIVSYIKHINIDKENRVEFWLTNFDFIDGSDYLAKVFCERYKMRVEDKIDGVWFSIIKLQSNDITYELLWHEDMGNIIYSTKQDKDSIVELEVRLNYVLRELNQRIYAAK